MIMGVEGVRGKTAEVLIEEDGRENGRLVESVSEIF